MSNMNMTDSFHDNDLSRSCDDDQAAEEENPNTGNTVRILLPGDLDDVDNNQADATFRTGDNKQTSLKEIFHTGGDMQILLPLCPDEVDHSQTDARNDSLPDKDKESDDDEESSKSDSVDESLSEDGDYHLPCDSFSMLFVAKWSRNDLVRSILEHFLPIGIFSVQMVIMVLLMISLLETSDRQLLTFMNVPVNVTPAVRISQYIACMVSVFTSDDLVTGALHVGRRVVEKERVRRTLIFSNTGHDICRRAQVRTLRREISDANVSAKNWKWEVTNSMRIIEGALVVVVSFIFIVQSVTAIDLWLNFAAVQFVGALDNTAYHLSKNRLFGSSARNLASRVKKFQAYPERQKGRKMLRRVRLALFVGIGLVMWASLSVFAYNQDHSTYACRSVMVTVGENRHVKYRHYSGRYVIQDDKIYRRPVYVQEQGKAAFLAYCGGGVNRWSISPLNNHGMLDPCGSIVLQSQRTKTHDVSEIGYDMQWWTGDSADADIKCNQCDTSRKGGDCSFRGTCNPENKLCNCTQGFFGDSCQFSGPCTEMVQHDEFHGHDTRGYQKHWDLMYLDGSPLMVYDRPVYVQDIDDVIFAVIAFDGGRWFVSRSEWFDDWSITFGEKENARVSLAKYLVNSFSARTSAYISSYISAESSILGSPSNIPFRAWLAQGAEDNIGRLGEEEYSMLCADCSTGIDDTDGLPSCTGAFGRPDRAICKATESKIHGDVSRCQCLSGFSGPLCYVRPIEGTSSLHLDHATGMCSTCFEDNIWKLWDLVQDPCTSIGKLYFENGNVAFSREIGLYLNASHLSVFVSSNNETSDQLCLARESTEEVYSVRRDTEERLHVDVAIHLDNREDFFGEVVKSNEVGCLVSKEIDHDVCSTSLRHVSDTKPSMLKHAWLVLDLKVTPNVGGDQSNDDAVAPHSESELVLADQDQVQVVSEGTPIIASVTSQEYRFAIIPKSTSSAFFLSVKSGCEERAAALSRPSVRGNVLVKCIFVGPTDTMPGASQVQLKYAMDLIRNRSIDGISMSVLDDAVTSEAIDSAAAANIPFITFDSDSTSSKRKAYVGTNNTALGEELGMLLMTRFATSGKYAIVSDVAPNLYSREVGIRSILDENGWSEVFGSPILNGEQASMSIQSMHDLMVKQPDTNAMILTLGVPMRIEDESWEEFVRQYPDLLILCASSTPKQIDLLNRGFVNGLVGQQPFEMGSKSIDTLLALSTGKTVEPFIATSVVVIGRVNKGNPYSQLSSGVAGTMKFTSIYLLIILTMLSVIVIV